MPEPRHCQYCGAELKVQSYYLDGWILEEEYTDCTNPECGWYYHFSYGAHLEGFTSKEKTEPTDIDEIPF